MALHPSMRIEGGLLGPDLLDQLRAGELPGQRPADFVVSPPAPPAAKPAARSNRLRERRPVHGGEPPRPRRSLTDEVARAFADARSLWAVFQHRRERLAAGDPGTSMTRALWVEPFLGLLDWELAYNRRAWDLDGLTFAISHRAGTPEDAPPVHIVGVGQELGRAPAAGRPRLAPHALLQEYLNRTEALWGLVTNGTMLRLLRDSTYHPPAGVHRVRPFGDARRAAIRGLRRPLPAAAPIAAAGGRRRRGRLPDRALLRPRRRAGRARPRAPARRRRAVHRAARQRLPAASSEPCAGGTGRGRRRLRPPDRRAGPLSAPAGAGLPLPVPPGGPRIGG